MRFSEIKDYYDTIKGSYVLVCKEEKNADLKSKIGDRFNSLLVVLFVLTFSQIIPLSVLGLLPEALKLIPFWKFGIPTIIETIAALQTNHHLKSACIMIYAHSIQPIVQ